jgi:hypothetical protein
MEGYRLHFLQERGIYLDLALETRRRGFVARPSSDVNFFQVFECRDG